MKKLWILDRIEDGKAIFESEDQIEITVDISALTSEIVMGGCYQKMNDVFYFDPSESDNRINRIKEKRSQIFKKKNPDR